MGLYKRKLVVKVAHQTVMATLTIMADVDGRWGVGAGRIGDAGAALGKESEAPRGSSTDLMASSPVLVTIVVLRSTDLGIGGRRLDSKAWDSRDD